MQLNLICETKHLSSNKILPRHYKVPIHRHKSKSQIPTPNQHNIKEPNKMKKIREQNEKKTLGTKKKLSLYKSTVKALIGYKAIINGWCLLIFFLIGQWKG